MYAKVIIDVAHYQMDRPFTYSVPEHLSVRPGHHVLVPFGAGNKPKEGFVVGVSETLPDEEEAGINCKSVIKCLESYTLFSENQLLLAEWMTENYNCLLIDALRTMIPSEIRGGRVKERKEKLYTVSDREKAESVLPFLRSPLQQNVLKAVLLAGEPVERASLTAEFPDAARAVRTLLEKKLIEETAETVFRHPGMGLPAASKPELTSAQRNVLQEFLKLPAGKTALLHGVTGSGKTEVYLRLIEDCLVRGQGAIVLVPEISLTPQTVGRFSARFEGRIAVLHSALSAGERFDEWRRIRNGEACIVIGARSAVFAPVCNLGLIIIDEEQETSYQSETSPRYSALEIARKRIQDENGKLLLGSATPSLLSYFRALNGTYALLKLEKRVLDRPMPAVHMIDMRSEFMGGNTGIFSAALTDGLRNCFQKGHQAMLFINRRGYSTFVSCRACGYVFKCGCCDISLTYHKSENRMRCHYCGSVEKLPSECPNCKKPFIKQFGIGTEQVEEQIHNLFPSVRTLRMDTDTVRQKNAYEEILSSFGRGEADVLIGTQMIAKGHDFPNVTTVGIVAADLSLNLPDYRSGERTFHLLTQMAGRAGRDAEPGEVYLQTYNTSHPVFEFAKRHDFNGFFSYEIAERKKCLYPPFSVFLRLVLQGEDEEALNRRGEIRAREIEKVILDALTEKNAPDLLLVHAAPAPVMRIQGKYRYQILFKLLRTPRIKDVLRAVYSFENENRGEDGEKLEVNPVEMF